MAYQIVAIEVASELDFGKGDKTKGGVIPPLPRFLLWSELLAQEGVNANRITG